jgi:hypothetical protein
LTEESSKVPEVGSSIGRRSRSSSSSLEREEVKVSRVKSKSKLKKWEDDNEPGQVQFAPPVYPQYIYPNTAAAPPQIPPYNLNPYPYLTQVPPQIVYPPPNGAIMGYPQQIAGGQNPAKINILKDAESVAETASLDEHKEEITKTESNTVSRTEIESERDYQNLPKQAIVTNLTPHQYVDVKHEGPTSKLSELYRK